MARRAKKRLQEPELRWRGEPEGNKTATRARAQVEKRAREPESSKFPEFSPKRKWEGGKAGPGGIIYIQYYCMIYHRRIGMRRVSLGSCG